MIDDFVPNVWADTRAEYKIAVDCPCIRTSPLFWAPPQIAIFVYRIWRIEHIKAKFRERNLGEGSSSRAIHHGISSSHASPPPSASNSSSLSSSYVFAPVPIGNGAIMDVYAIFKPARAGVAVYDASLQYHRMVAFSVLNPPTPLLLSHQTISGVFEKQRSRLFRMGHKAFAIILDGSPFGLTAISVYTLSPTSPTSNPTALIIASTPTVSPQVKHARIRASAERESATTCSVTAAMTHIASIRTATPSASTATLVRATVLDTQLPLPLQSHFLCCFKLLVCLFFLAVVFLNFSRAGFGKAYLVNENSSLLPFALKSIDITGWSAHRRIDPFERKLAMDEHTSVGVGVE
ncbi:hypothetical protein BOTBODRAFT_180226 [Botryobasidium botryosum FD-172 SS1]|uniref:Uncharacterized protein n=1 Tax=Botryobasidium botryosum (strain FD-172 SS1) TaxID=930990 RepID=A0A067LZZ5_BOTB1|nr:hypothetical protein BOTBODRAFT_180226 [Botryobasidium botryosum FD-172 SS1]